MPWQHKLAGVGACALPGLLVRLSGGSVPYPVQSIVYGTSVLAAAFLLAWACEAAEHEIGSGLAVAIVAFVAILPEYVVEVYFAFSGHVEFVTANLTGATRLILGFGVALPVIVALLPVRWRADRVMTVDIAPQQRIELAVLGAGALFALRAVLTGNLMWLDSIVFVSLYVIYLRRVGASDAERPQLTGIASEIVELPTSERRRWIGGLMLFAAFVILVTAEPFANSLLRTGAMVGISPYLLVQWLVPVATEAPELAVAFVLMMHGRPRQAVAVLLAGAVSQMTLALGTLPIAFLLGKGAGPLPLAHREQVELFLTISVALFTIAAFATLRLRRSDAMIMAVLFAAQFLVPSVFTRLALALVLVALAVDVLSAERGSLPALVSALLGSDNAPQRGREVPSPPDAAVRVHRDEPHARQPAAFGGDVDGLDVDERVPDGQQARSAHDRAVDRGLAEVPRLPVEQV
jgi:cation:H+ antiporter